MDVSAHTSDRPALKDSARLIIKIGSSLLVDADSGELNREWLDALAGELARLHARGQQVLVVSSGAIALGRRYLGMRGEQRRLEDHQAAAAAGQIRLAHAWQEVLGARNIKVAQILLTLDDTEDRRRYLNARSTLENLLSRGVVPVINENDTVATQEIRYGDNDRLAARVAEMTGADSLLLLSDVDGLFEADPAEHENSKLISTVADITPDIERLAGASRTEFGSGGMKTKIVAARIATAAGCATVIASGRHLRPVERLEKGGPCTWFLAKVTPRAARKQWIGGTLTPKGALIIDGGAEAALAKGRSLLPAGVLGVEGDFERGDAVQIKTQAGLDIARGLAAYSSADATLLCGRQSQEIEALLGYRGRDEIVHRDNLVMLNG